MSARATAAVVVVAALALAAVNVPPLLRHNHDTLGRGIALIGVVLPLMLLAFVAGRVTQLHVIAQSMHSRSASITLARNEDGSWLALADVEGELVSIDVPEGFDSDTAMNYVLGKLTQGDE